MKGKRDYVSLTSVETVDIIHNRKVILYERRYDR